MRVLELPDGFPPERWWSGGLDGVAAVLLLASGDVPPADLVPGTHLLAESGRRVPVGVLPAAAAPRPIAALQRRRDERLARGPVALLGSREDRARRLLDALEENLRRDPSLAVARLGAERLPRYGLPGALAPGPGLAVYVGQGHWRGWAGYGGVEAWQLDVPAAQPIGAVLSLTCRTGARAGAAPGFCEELVVRGRGGAALGAVDLTPHEQNRSLALAIAGRLAEGAATVADLLPAADPALAGYRLCGDPLAPLLGAPGSRRGIAAVLAPAPGEAPPPSNRDERAYP